MANGGGGQDEVIIKVSADIATAAAALTTLVGQMGEMLEVFKTTTKETEEATPKVEGFFKSWITGANQSQSATLSWGMVMAKSFGELRDGLTDVVKSVPNMITGMAKVGDEMYTMSKRMDISATGIAELQYIADQSGTSMQALARTMQTFGMSIQDSGGKAAKGLASIGLSLEDLNKLSKEEQFFKVIQTIKEAPDVTDKSAKAMEIFGGKFRMSTQLMDEDIGKLRARFKELGGPDGMEALAKGGDAWSDALGDLKLVQDGFKTSLTNLVLGPMTQVAQALPALGGAVLTLGSTFVDVGKSMAPMVTNLALVTIQKEGFSAFVTSVTTGLGSMTKGFWAMTAAMLSNPWTWVAAAVVALGVAIYNLIGGWEGLLAMVKAVTDAMQPLLDALQPVNDAWADLATIVGDRLVKSFDDLKVSITGAYDAQMKAWEEFRKGEGIVGVLTGKVKDLIGWFSKFPIVEAAIKNITNAFNELSGMAGTAFGKIKGFFTGMVGDIKKEADGIREQHWWDKQLEDIDKFASSVTGATAAVKEHVGGMDALAKRTADINAVMAKFTPVLQARIKAELEAGTSAKLLGDAMAKDLGVDAEIATAAIEKYKKSVDDAASAAKSAASADPFKKLMESAKDLAAQMALAEKAGIPLNQRIAEFGKKSAEIANQAALRGELSKIPPVIVAMDKAWTEAQLAEKMQAINKEALDLSKTFSDKLKAATAATTAAVVAMEEEITNKTLSASELRLKQLKKEHDAKLAQVQTEKDALLAALEVETTKIKANTDKAIAAAKANLKANEEFTAARLAQILAVEEQAIISLTNQTEVQLANLDTQTAGLDKYYSHQTDLVNEQIAEQDRQAQLWWDEQDRIQYEAEQTAETVKVSWDETLGSITSAFDQLANISGDTFGGMLKGFGEAIGMANTLIKSLGGVMAAWNKKGGAGGGVAGGMSGKLGAAAGWAGMGIGAFSGGYAAGKEGGAGKGALSGAASGALMGTMIMPGIGTAIGAGIGALGGWLGGRKKKKEEKAAKEIGKEWGITISTEAGNEIAKRAKDMFGGNQVAAAVYSMSDLVEAAGGITTANFSKMLGHLTSVFDLVKQGSLSVEQGTKVLDENFGAFASHIVESGQLATKEFTDILRLQQEMGTESKAIQEFVVGQTSRLGSALGTLAGSMKNTAESVGRFETLTVGSFNAALAAGMGYIDAIEAFSPALDAIIAKHKEMGTTGGAAIQELLHFRKVAVANKELVDSVGALNEVMLALSNIGGLNVETMAALQAQGNETFAQLTAAGFTEMQSLQQMKGYLENIEKAHKDLGLPIDENTQKLLDQAHASGVLRDEQMSTNDIMLQGLTSIIKALGGEVPAAFKKMEKAAVSTAATINGGMVANTTAATDMGTAVAAVPFDQFADAAVTATNVAAKQFDVAAGAVSGVSAQLQKTDWGGWASDAANAANKAKDAVDALAVGASPGGIKDIPILLAQSTTAAQLFARKVVQDMAAAKRGVEGWEMPTFGGRPDLGAFAATAGGPGGADAGGDTYHFTFDIHAIDSHDMAAAVENQILPQMLATLGRGKQLTTLRELVR